MFVSIPIADFNASSAHTNVLDQSLKDNSTNPRKDKVTCLPFDEFKFGNIFPFVHLCFCPYVRMGLFTCQIPVSN
jgi:hypothetical protein